MGGPVCVGCGALQQPPARPDPFVVLGLPRRYHVAPSEVESRYLRVARVVHPDKFVSRPESERRLALLWTAALNEARRVLRDPASRARYLATGRAEPSEAGPKLDPAFLAEMFAWREQDEDEPGSVAPLAAARRAELQAEIEDIFSRWEANEGNLEAVDERLARLKYVDGLLRPRQGD